MLVRRFIIALSVLFALTGLSASSALADTHDEDAGVQTAQAAEATIDINTASAAELTKLKGIGKAKAAAIVEYREQNGPFKSVDDLTKVKGIGKKTLENLRDHITTGQADAAAAATTTTTTTTTAVGSLGSEAVKLAPGGDEEVVDLDALADADADAEVEGGAAAETDDGMGAKAQVKAEAKVAASAGGRINLNKASAAELTKLKGVGKKTAEKIIEYREQNGPFKSVDDLTRVKGIGKKTLENMRDQLTVE